MTPDSLSPDSMTYVAYVAAAYAVFVIVLLWDLIAPLLDGDADARQGQDGSTLRLAGLVDEMRGADA